MIETGDLCPFCHEKQMPPWKQGETARSCQNCKLVQPMKAYGLCRVAACHHKSEVLVIYPSIELELCIKHSSMQEYQVKKMVASGLII